MGKIGKNSQQVSLGKFFSSQVYKKGGQKGLKTLIRPYIFWKNFTKFPSLEKGGVKTRHKVPNLHRGGGGSAEVGLVWYEDLFAPPHPPQHKENHLSILILEIWLIPCPLVGFNFFPMAPMLCKKAVVNMAKLFMLLTDNQTCRQHPFISRWIFSAKCRWFEKNGISRWLARRKWNKMEKIRWGKRRKTKIREKKILFVL